ncbi:MAG: phosphoribosylanthranilate isomerase [Bacteroidia bacterium]|nr:phosphoribosylanthranilate isomerase [Bacteroidia bacterium]
MRLKVCGLRDPENIEAVAQLRPDMIGFIFYRNSPRYAGEMPRGIFTPGIIRVGVFVDADLSGIFKIRDLYNLDMIQLHGNESPAFCRQLKKETKVMKAIAVTCAEDIRCAAQFEGEVDHLLFDNRSALYGGTGKKFDHLLLENYSGNTPFFLSGGIGEHEVTGYRNFCPFPMMAGLDLNSKFEIRPGLKDIKRLKSLLT